MIPGEIWPSSIRGAGHYVLGQIEFGQEKEKLAAMDQNFVATIEQIE